MSWSHLANLVDASLVGSNCRLNWRTLLLPRLPCRQTIAERRSAKDTLQRNPLDCRACPYGPRSLTPTSWWSAFLRDQHLPCRVLSPFIFHLSFSSLSFPFFLLFKLKVQQQKIIVQTIRFQRTPNSEHLGAATYLHTVEWAKIIGILTYVQK